MTFPGNIYFLMILLNCNRYFYFINLCYFLDTLGINMADMVTRFRTGIYYTAHRDESEQDYGWIDTTIGKVS